jgi:hypothetical protein
MMSRHVAAPGAPGPPWLVMTSCTTSRLTCRVQVVPPRLAGGAAEAVPQARKAAATAAA